MAAEPAALRDNGDGAGRPGRQTRRRLRREEHRRETFGEVHEAEAVGSDQRQPTRSRDFANPVLLADAVAADFGETGREDHRDFHLAPHAAFNRFPDGARRQCEDGEIHTLRNIVDARQHLVAFDIGAASADQINRAAELVVAEKLKDDPSRRTRFGGHADDRNAARAHESGDGGGRHAAAVSLNVRRHVCTSLHMDCLVGFEPYCLKVIAPGNRNTYPETARAIA